MPSTQYKWITWLGARQALAARLADSGNVFWTDAENALYLREALRTWNALTEVWNQTYSFTPNSAGTWYDLSILSGSPRIRTILDTDLYTIMQYHLLEPPSGGTWTGTSQFSIADFSNSLQRRRDEVIQATGCNLQQLPRLPSVPNSRRAVFPDSTLEPRRARFVPDSGFGSPFTMTREDSYAFDGFQANHLQVSQIPSSWGVVSGPPLTMDVNTSPNVPGAYDVISLQAGYDFLPPAATLMNVPDDWAWLAKWGALADLLGRDSEATDRLRADYCLKRFQVGLKIMQEANWLLSATINGMPVDTPSMREADGFAPEWQDNAAAWPSLITAGTDFFAPCPIAVDGHPRGVSMVVVGNAPMPVRDTDFVQISRDVFDAILDYAQLLATFKQGGAEFVYAADLEKNFFTVAQANNERLAKMGIFSDMLHLEGLRQNINQPR
jgi:hypothetical protein